MKTLKSITSKVILGLAVVLFSASCDELMDQFGISIETDAYEFELTINPSEAGEYAFSQEALPSNIDSIIAAEGYDMANLTGVYVKDAVIEIVSTSEGANFDGFKSLEAVILQGGISSVVASVYDIEDGLNKIQFNVTDENVVDYLNKSEIVLEIRGVLENDLEETLEIEGSISYELEIGF